MTEFLAEMTGLVGGEGGIGSGRRKEGKETCGIQVRRQRKVPNKLSPKMSKSKNYFLV